MLLHFGIPSLDELLKIPATAEKDEPESTATSIALIGPDGSGKSVLALHLASRYRADCRTKLLAQNPNEERPRKFAGPEPLILYVSSDFKYESANRVWKNFGLDRPNLRQIPFERTPQAVARLDYRELSINLRNLIPGQEDADGGDARTSLIDFLFSPKDPVCEEDLAEVGFLDLATHTTGDDWTFVNSIFARLESVRLPKAGDRLLRHLVIVDSVAGFETFVGELDAFGLKQTRRSRIAQSMRNSDPHCHVVFVVEEPNVGERLPEEYVTDAVLRLRLRMESARPIRTIEVEKARARSHAMGEHPFEIRGPGGSSTGEWANPDTPHTKNAYVQVFHSLPHRNLLIALDPGKGRSEPKNTVCPMGLEYLDELLTPGHPVVPYPFASAGSRPIFGLRSGTATAIIGETATGKSALAERFLAEGFRQVVEDAIHLFAICSGVAAKASASRRRDSLTRTLLLLRDSVISPEEDQGHQPAPPAPSLNPTVAVPMLWEAWEYGEKLSQRCLADLASGSGYSAVETLSDPGTLLSKVDLRRQVFTLLRPGDLKEKLGWRRSRSKQLPELKEPRNIPSGGLPLSRASAFIHRLFRHYNLRRPAVLLTTSDRTVPEFADRCLQYLGDLVSNAWPGSALAARWLLATLKKILEEQIIVRRFDIDHALAPVVFQVVQRSLVEAHHLLYGPYFPPTQISRFPKANRIRLVIDDCRVLSSICPTLSTESAFYPFLTFFLEREGVTTLMVHSHATRAEGGPRDGMTETFHCLMKQAIHTWNVPFEGRTRIAVSVSPASSIETNGLVRELELPEVNHYKELLPGATFSPKPAREPIISPKFELYTGLEEGRPNLVPVAIYIFNATPNFEAYIAEQNSLLRRLFVPIKSHGGASDSIMLPLSEKDYHAIRDRTHLPTEVQEEHATVFQVDGFWSLSEDGALTSQAQYLHQKLPPDKPHASHEDPFGLFRMGPMSPKDPPRPSLRKHYFCNSEYKCRVYNLPEEAAAQGRPDRVPFMWDFSLILARESAWESAGEEELTKNSEGGDGNPWATSARRYPKVKSVYEELIRNKEEKTGVVPWRQFFGAARAVADSVRRSRGVEATPFDFAATSSETLNCLFLEVWFSEIMLAMSAYPDWRDSNNVSWKERCTQLSLSQYNPSHTYGPKSNHLSLEDLLVLVPGADPKREKPVGTQFKKFRDNHQARFKYNDKAGASEALAEEVKLSEEERRELFKSLPVGALCLYKTWLLLLDVLDFETLLNSESVFDLRQPKKASRRAVASRHWYRTASPFTTTEAEPGILDPAVVLRMPGYFSTRGDSFLASPRSSRSRLLAAHVIDLLSSRRANLTRMQMGLGLPVRDILADDACGDLRTAVRAIGPGQSGTAKKILREVTYSELSGYGAVYAKTDQGTLDCLDPKRTSQKPESCPTLWLFRSAIADYDRVSRTLQNWLTDLLRWTVSYVHKHESQWEGGLRPYDHLSAYRFVPLASYDSFLEFADLCDLLVAGLRAARRDA